MHNNRKVREARQAYGNLTGRFATGGVLNLCLRRKFAVRKKGRVITMADFFKEHREEVVGASIWEFDQELNDQAKYEDGYDNGYDNGKKEGVEKGQILSLIDKVCIKLKKEKPIEEIADALEESIEEIEKIANAAQKFAPEYPLDKIYGFIKQTGNRQ